MSHVDSGGHKLAAAILAGGTAGRYGGAPKGLLEVTPGVSILENIIRELKSSGIEEIAIVANDPDPYKSYSLPIVPDLRTGIGPLGGMEAGLAHFAGRCDAVLFLPCDLPAITSEEISALTSASDKEPDLVVFARAGRFYGQPLCAVVPNAFREAISKAIDDGKRKVGEVWRELGAHIVHFDDPAPFFNVNTPDDMAAWHACKKGNFMKTRLCAPEDMTESIQRLVESEQMSIQVVSEGECDVKVVRSEDRAESDLNTLQSGGWIKCEVARAGAKKLRTSTRKTGKLLDLLDIKVRECGLGCF